MRRHITNDLRVSSNAFSVVLFYHINYSLTFLFNFKLNEKRINISQHFSHIPPLFTNPQAKEPFREGSLSTLSSCQYLRLSAPSIIKHNQCKSAVGQCFLAGDNEMLGG